MAKALYDVADHFGDAAIAERAQELVRDEVAADPARAARAIAGRWRARRAAVYTGGAFKAFSLVRSLRTLGMQTVMVGSQTGNREDYELLRELCDEGTILVDDTNPLELSRFLQEKEADLLIGGVKERPIAYKLGIGFCDHNHEREDRPGRLPGDAQFRPRGPLLGDAPGVEVVPRAGTARARSKEDRHDQTLPPPRPSRYPSRPPATPAGSAPRWGRAWPSAAWKGPCPCCTARKAAPPTSAAT